MSYATFAGVTAAALLSAVPRVSATRSQQPTPTNHQRRNRLATPQAKRPSVALRPNHGAPPSHGQRIKIAGLAAPTYLPPPHVQRLTAPQTRPRSPRGRPINLERRQNSAPGHSQPTWRDQIRQEAVVELGGIEPPSVERLPPPIRPFPVTALRVAHRRVDCPLGLRRIFLRCQWSFPPSAVFPCCPPLLLLPGCSGQAPRAPVGVAVTSQTDQVIRLRGARVHHCRVIGAPFLESEQLRSRSTVPDLDVETDQPLVNVRSCHCTELL